MSALPGFVDADAVKRAMLNNMEGVDVYVESDEDLDSIALVSYMRVDAEDAMVFILVDEDGDVVATAEVSIKVTLK